MLIKCGKDIELNVDVARFSPAVMEHVVYMGLRNILMDAHASHTKDQPDYLATSREASQAKLASMYEGEVRAVGTRATDPVAVTMRQVAISHVRDAIRKAGKKINSYSSEEITAAVNKHLEKNAESLRKTAEKMVRDAAASKVDMEGII